MTSLTVDRLRVFVSSTIEECAAERAAVRDAILSINHEPVLFEDIGARPHPPREIYKARLQISHIFIGIYRESYGWIAPGMRVSGIEDEFRLAVDLALDRLVYIFQKSTVRDPKLQVLIDAAKNSGITVKHYSDAQALRDHVRNDLTAVVSNRFVDQAVVSREAPKAEEVLDSLVPNPSHRFHRPGVEAGLIDTLNRFGRIVVIAPIGSGKTILLAQLSVKREWVFVDGQGLNRLDLLARAANAIRERLGRPPVTLTTEQAAIQELLKGRDGLSNVTLAVDGSENPMFLWEILANDHRLVLTSRSPLGVSSNQCFNLPPLTGGEVAAWVTALRGIKPVPGELADLVVRSGGSPLYLRFYALGEKESADMSLRELETRAIESLPPRAKEITSYVALSTRPLSLGDIDALVGSQEGPESMARQVSTASGLLRQIRGKLVLVHDHLRKTILEQLHQDEIRLKFFASRLGRFFEESEHHLAAFHVYIEANEQRQADQVIDRASNQAELMGGGAPAIPVFRRQVELAQESGEIEKGLFSHLTLALAYKQTGSKADAACALDQARATAKRLNEPVHYLRVREVEAVLNIGDKTRKERIAELEALRNLCTENDDLFNAARTGTLLTAEYTFGQDFLKAEQMSREVLQVFTDLGDEYGKRVARLNLATALSGIEGRETEAASIAQELQQELVPEEYPRERAVLCNYLTRYYRRSGDTARAAESALEAIEIGERLGDLHVIASNRTTLGNVRRDEGNLEQALIEYRAAEQASVTAGLRDAESAANELIASVLNQRKEHQVALHHAQHAAATARLAGDHFLVARAEEEHAIALTGHRDFENAIGAYTDAATAVSKIHPGGSFFVKLISDALHLCATTKRNDLMIKLLKGVFIPELNAVNDEDIDSLDVMYRALPKMADTITQVDRLLPTIALLMADLLADVTPLIERRIILQTTDALLPKGAALPTTSRLAAVAVTLMVQSGRSLALEDVVEIAERLAASSPRIYFKPRPDGSAYWTLRMGIANGVVVSLVQLDDSPKTSITTSVLALLLLGLTEVIRQQLLDTEQLPRQEVVINVVKREKLENQLGSDLLKLGDMPNGFVVAESTDVTQNDQPPIIVICADQFPMPWRPTGQALPDYCLVLGELLRVLAAHLLARAVEPEVLFPKIARVIQRIAYKQPDM